MSRHNDDCLLCLDPEQNLFGIPPITCLIRMHDLPEELELQAAKLSNACLAEAGYPTEYFLDSDGRYAFPKQPIPFEIRVKARMMVCDHLGIPYPEPQLKEVI